MKLTLVAMTCALALGAAPSASAQDSLEDVATEWPALLPALTLMGSPTPPPDIRCPQDDCAGWTAKEMEKRARDMIESCDHRAAFALTYLVTTRVIQRNLKTLPFADRDFVDRQAALFAAMYFAAYDDWVAGRTDRVPGAWQKSFAAAQQSSVSGTGNILMGMSAHVNHDLPFVLASMGLIAPDGSRKDDHDMVNQALYDAVDEVFAAVAERLDPSVRGAEIDGTPADEYLRFQLLPVWREQAWRNAERLAQSPPGGPRDAVAADIEASSRFVTDVVGTATAYGVLDDNERSQRDSHCQAISDEPGYDTP